MYEGGYYYFFLITAMGWIVSPANSYVEGLILVPQNVTVFVDKSLWKVTALKWGVYVGPNPI